MRWDTIIRGGRVVTPEGVVLADLALADGLIAEISPAIAGPAGKEIDASGCHLLPGLIDPHVHFNDPGRAEWEGIKTGSDALAAGGGTLFVDMPLNASPPTLDAAAFDAKLACARGISRTDFAFWGGLVPGHVDHGAVMHSAGVKADLIATRTVGLPFKTHPIEIQVQPRNCWVIGDVIRLRRINRADARQRAIIKKKPTRNPTNRQAACSQQRRQIIRIQGGITLTR